MKSYTFIVALLALLSIPISADDATQQPQVLNPQEFTWNSPPQIKGLSGAWIIGAEQQHGLYTVRVKLQPGAIIPPHTHPDERNSVVLSGNLYVGFGEVFDENAVVKVAAGSVYIAPAGVAHYLWAKDGAVEYQEVGFGPSATAIVTVAKP